MLYKYNMPNTFGKICTKKERIFMNMFNIMTIKEFAKVIGRGVSTIYDWKNNGTIPANCFKQIGSIWYVKIDEIKVFLAS